jgi:hypothetical protein
MKIYKNFWEEKQIGEIEREREKRERERKERERLHLGRGDKLHLRFKGSQAATSHSYDRGNTFEH